MNEQKEKHGAEQAIAAAKIVVIDSLLERVIKDPDCDNDDIINMLMHHSTILIAATIAGHLKHGCEHMIGKPREIAIEFEKQITETLEQICQEHDIKIPVTHNQRVAEEIMQEIEKC